MVAKEEYPALLEGLVAELRRGSLGLAVLSQLSQPQYGYSLKQQLAAQGMDIPEGTLYPLLRRLEAQGLLESEWRVVDEARPRRYYRISPRGQQALADLTHEWQAISQALAGLLHGDKK
ncbi:MAG TPA: PadR family transcriptional regulator [Anaerolineales bacterium]|nr:PadR family transcriptional regulator [Anaerolineales bacterium]HRQ92604.1 PadR family transcriptional regulator [Anaerolineales bacterium]